MFFEKVYIFFKSIYFLRKAPSRTPYPPPPPIKTLSKALYVGRKASPLQLELGSESSSEVRIENVQKFLKYFLETTFPYYYMFYATLITMSRKYFFGFFLEISSSDRKFSKSKYFKSFSGNYSSCSCSCFMLP